MEMPKSPDWIKWLKRYMPNDHKKGVVKEHEDINTEDNVLERVKYVFPAAHHMTCSRDMDADLTVEFVVPELPVWQEFKFMDLRYKIHVYGLKCVGDDWTVSMTGWTE